MPPATSITQLVWIDSAGYHLSDYPSFLAWITAQYQGIYGADVYIDPDSMDGQFLAILAQAFYDTGALGSAVYNSFSPLTAQGYGLARLVLINGIQKEVPTFSTVSLTIVGVAGTVITNGIASDVLNQQWLLPSSTTIPSGGSISVLATAALVGQVFADTGTVTNIFTPTNGWQTVNNPGPASPGDPVEQDGALRIRQSVSTSLPAITILDATAAAIQNLPGTEQNGVVAYDNDTNANDGVTGIPAHTVCFVVASSATALAICETIQLYKTPGTGTFGTQFETVFDSKGMPIVINYQPVVTKSFQVTVNLTTGQGWSSNSIALIQNAIAAFVATIPIGSGASIGVQGLFYYTTLYPVIYGAVPGNTFDVNSITVGVAGGGQSAANVNVNFQWQLVTDPLTDVTVNT